MYYESFRKGREVSWSTDLFLGFAGFTVNIWDDFRSDEFVEALSEGVTVFDLDSQMEEFLLSGNSGSAGAVAYRDSFPSKLTLYPLNQLRAVSF